MTSWMYSDLPLGQVCLVSTFDFASALINGHLSNYSCEQINHQEGRSINRLCQCSIISRQR